MVELSNAACYIVNLPLVLFLAVVFLSITCYLSFLWKKRHMFIKSWKVPGPLNIPVIGAGYMFMCKPEFILNKILELHQNYPEGGKLWFGNRLIYFLTEPHHIERVLGSTRLVQKDVLYKHVVDTLGEGLLQAPAQKWRKHRKAIAPAFSQKILDSFVEVFAKQSEVMTEVLLDQLGKDVDIHSVLSRCTLDILCETAMGLQLNIQKSNSDHAENFDKMAMMTFLKLFHIWNHVDFIWKIQGHEKKLKSYVNKFNDLVDKVIQEKKEASAATKNSSDLLLPNEDAKPWQKLAFLDYIIENKDFSAIELRDEVKMFLFAGTDTTAATLSFVITMLGMFPVVQQKVYEEVVAIMGKYRPPEPSDLSQMVYTERVIKESMRLFPVGSFFLRTITEDVDMGDFEIPKGASAYFGVIYIHRNPKYWPDPLKFDPDRFLPEEIRKRHPCTYIPFSYGPRNCIGRVYGMMNMKVVVATVVRKFLIHCGYRRIQDIELKSNIVLRFRHGARVSFTLRE